MNFRPELAAKVMSGEKTVTRRLTSDNPRSPWWKNECSLNVGQDYSVCPGRGKNAIGRVRIVSVRLGPLGWLTEAEARAEGFASAVSFAEAFSDINGKYSDRTLVWRIEFEVADIEADEPDRTGSPR